MWLACSSARATALKPLFSLLPSKARSMESLCSSLTGTAIVRARQRARGEQLRQVKLKLIPDSALPAARKGVLSAHLVGRLVCDDLLLTLRVPAPPCGPGDGSSFWCCGVMVLRRAQRLGALLCAADPRALLLQRHDHAFRARAPRRRGL